MSIIYKYELADPFEGMELDVHAQAEIVHFAVQGRSLHVWVSTQPLHVGPREFWPLKVIATGQEFSLSEFEVIGSTIDGPFVWHLLKKRTAVKD